MYSPVDEKTSTFRALDSTSTAAIASLLPGRLNVMTAVHGGAPDVSSEGQVRNRSVKLSRLLVWTWLVQTEYDKSLKGVEVR